MSYLFHSFQYNLIYVHQLVIPFDAIDLFSRTLCQWQGPSLKKPLVLSRLDNGLYNLEILASIPLSFKCISNYVVSSTEVSACNVALISDSLINTSFDSKSGNTINKMDVFWHFRLGNLPFSRMKNIIVVNSSLSLK